MIDAKQLDDFKEMAYENLDKMAVALNEYESMGFLNRSVPINDYETEKAIYGTEADFHQTCNVLYKEFTKINNHVSLVPLLVTQVDMLAHMTVWLGDLIRSATDNAVRGASICLISNRLKQTRAKFHEYVLSFICQIEVETAVWNLLLGKMSADDVKSLSDGAIKELAKRMGAESC